MKSEKKIKIEDLVLPLEEQPYKIPDNWIWTRYFPIFKEISQNEKKIEEKNYSSFGKIPIISQGKEKIIGYSNEIKIQPYDAHNYPLIIFGDHTLNIKYVDFSFLIGADGVKVLKTSNIFIPKLLFYYLENLKISTMKNTGYRRHFPILKTLSFTLPPLEEQKRIVEKLDYFSEKINRLKALIEEVKADIENRKIAILDKAFKGELTAKWREKNSCSDILQLLENINKEKIAKWEDECAEAEKNGNKKPKKPTLKSVDEMIVSEDESPYEIPDTWRWVKLENLSFKITDGAHKTPKYIEKGIHFISVKDIRDNKIYFDDTKFISESEHIELYKRCNPEYGDVLITKSGTIGRTAIVEVDFEFSLFVSVALIKNFKNIILSKYLSKNIEDYINKINVGSEIKGGVIKNYHITDIKEQKIPLPPLEEQKEIIRILDEILERENKISEILKMEEQINLLEKSILNKAFRGELGTGNMNDVPALEMLRQKL